MLFQLKPLRFIHGLNKANRETQRWTGRAFLGLHSELHHAPGGVLIIRYYRDVDLYLTWCSVCEHPEEITLHLES